MTDINQININTIEGKYLMAALAKLTTESQTDKTPYEVLAQVKELAERLKAAQGKEVEFAEWKDNGNIIAKDKNVLLVNGEPVQFYEIQGKLYDMAGLFETFKSQLLTNKVK